MYIEKAKYQQGKIKWILLNNDLTINEEALFFSNMLSSQGYSINSINGYLRDLKMYFEYLILKDIRLEEIRPLHVSQFVDYLKGNEQEDVTNIDLVSRRATSTINRVLAALSTFYRILENVDQKMKSPFKFFEGDRPYGMYKFFLNHIQSGKIRKRSIKVRTKSTNVTMGKDTDTIRYFDNATASRLFPDEVKRFYAGLNNFRDRLIFDILYETGMRIGELLGLKINDYSEIDPDKKFGYIYIIFDEDNDDPDRQPKTGSRTIPVTMELITMIDEYVTEYRPYSEGQEYIFVSHSNNGRGNPMSRVAVENIFKECSLRTKIKCTPHRLRHTHFTELKEAGYDQLFIKHRAGHKSIYTTEKYIHPSLEAQTKAFANFVQLRKEKVL